MLIEWIMFETSYFSSSFFLFTSISTKWLLSVSVPVLLLLVDENVVHLFYVEIIKRNGQCHFAIQTRSSVLCWTVVVFFSGYLCFTRSQVLFNFLSLHTLIILPCVFIKCAPFAMFTHNYNDEDDEDDDDNNNRIVFTKTLHYSFTRFYFRIV